MCDVTLAIQYIHGWSFKGGKHKVVEMIGQRGNALGVNQLLYADDAVLIVDLEENLTELLKEFNAVCKKRKLKVSGGKSKVMVCAKTERRDRLILSVNGDMLEVVDSFK